MVKANYVTGKLPWIATALEVKTALKNLPNMGDVDVSLMNVVGGFTYNITFTSSVGNLPELELTTTDLTGSVTADLTSLTNGTTPAFYCGSFTGATPCPEVTDLTSPPFSYDIVGLTPGVTYYTRVMAANNIGYGVSRVSTPLSMIPPF
jgi:hypothetical protein